MGTPIHRHEAGKQKGSLSLTPNLLRTFKKGNFDEINVLRTRQAGNRKKIQPVLMKVLKIFSSNIVIPPTAAM